MGSFLHHSTWGIAGVKLVSVLQAWELGWGLGSQRKSFCPIAFLCQLPSSHVTFCSLCLKSSLKTPHRRTVIACPSGLSPPCWSVSLIWGHGKRKGRKQLGKAEVWILLSSDKKQSVWAGGIAESMGAVWEWGTHGPMTECSDPQPSSSRCFPEYQLLDPCSKARD